MLHRQCGIRLRWQANQNNPEVGFVDQTVVARLGLMLPMTTAGAYIFITRGVTTGFSLPYRRFQSVVELNEMKASIRWVQDVMFIAESESGHAVVIDGPAASGGRNIGVRPMEMMLMGMGGCTSFDVMNMLSKARQQVTDCVAELSAERAEDVPSVFTRIHIHFVVSGRQLKESQVKRAIELSAEKYCSASIMMSRAGVDVTHDYEIIEVP